MPVQSCTALHYFVLAMILNPHVSRKAQRAADCPPIWDDTPRRAHWGKESATHDANAVVLGVLLPRQRLHSSDSTLASTARHITHKSTLH